MKFGKTSARKQMTLNDIAADRQQWKNQHQHLAEISWTMNTWPDLTYVSHNSCSWPKDVSIPTDTFTTSVANVPNNHDWINHMLLCKCTDVQLSGDSSPGAPPFACTGIKPTTVNCTGPMELLIQPCNRHRTLRCTNRKQQKSK